MSDRINQVLGQTEFLNALSSLMSKYDASFDTEETGDGRVRITINACGTWVPWHDIYHDLSVDDVIEATKATVEHAKSIS